MILQLSFSKWLVILSSVIFIYGGSKYIIDTIRGNTKPNKVSWIMWGLTAFIGSVVALYSGADIWPTVRVLLSALLSAVVLPIAFINPKSYWKLTRFDVICGILSFFALLFWLLLDLLLLSIVLASIANLFAALPTIIKAWKNPETETAITYLTGLIAILLVFPSMPRWDIAHTAYQLSIVLNCCLLLFAVYRKRLSIKFQ